jgi:hypothetical protein
MLLHRSIRKLGMTSASEARLGRCHIRRQRGETRFWAGARTFGNKAILSAIVSGSQTILPFEC